VTTPHGGCEANFKSSYWAAAGFYV
jgi:hypothetical protein